MKLVEILARELKEWPEGYKAIVQNNKDYTLPIDCLDVYWDGSQWDYKKPSMRIYEKQFSLSSIASDHATAIVTREMWQAAKYKLEGKVKAPKANKDGWKRHRGGKCPVEAGTLIDVRYRDGQVNIGVGACDGSKGSASRSAVYWRHDGDSANIMAYRLHKPGLVTDKESLTVEQANERAFDACVEKCAADDIEMPASLLVDPLVCRDRIHAIDAEQKAADEAHKAATDARTAERAELVQKLAGEGLALLDKCHALMNGVEERHGAPVEDMSDWRKWKSGDLVSTGRDPGGYSSVSNGVHEIEIDEDDDGCPVAVNGLWFTRFEVERDLKWHSRPTA